MVIDIHAHPLPDRPNEQACDRMVDLARRAGVDQLVLLGVVGRYGPYPTVEQIQESNDVTLAWMNHRPDACHGFGYLNPQHDPAFSRAELDRCLDGGMKGIKLWIAVKATDPRLDPIMELAADRDIPVLHHSWYKTVQAYEHESDPAEIADLARRHPKVKLIMAHLTGCGQRGVADIARCPNVSIDTSGSQPAAGMIEYAVRELGSERVVFGSDVCGRDFAVAAARVQGAKLTPRQRRLVLGGNAQRLLGLREGRS